ncbi:MAG: hypothetical protein EOM80_18515, partial [Erysipelotrichia bacterium]|nr:hypothetical protein [Erysipelotrichia bacterium]
MKYPEYIAIGLAFFGVGAFIAYEWYKLRRKINDMLKTPTSTIGSLLNTSQKQGRMVEIKGTLSPAGPMLHSPYTDRDCVFFHSLKKDKYKDVSRNSGGKNRSSIRYQTVEELKSEQLFYVEDRTGRIAIDPLGLTIEAQQVLKTEKACDVVPGAGLFGIFSPPPGDYYLAALKEEYILAPQKRVYVIGELYRGQKEPFIGVPLDKTVTALVSVKTEETIIEENR